MDIFYRDLIVEEDPFINSFCTDTHRSQVNPEFGSQDQVKTGGDRWNVTVNRQSYSNRFHFIQALSNNDW